MTAASCGNSAQAKSGFGHNSVFTKSVYNALGQSSFYVSQKEMMLSFRKLSTSNAHATTKTFQEGGHGGRSVRIIAINGRKVNETSTIDSGNSSFLSYGPGSALSAARNFPFSITFEGG